MPSVNPWKGFQQVINRSSRIIVTITANNGDGTSTATTARGNTIVVDGEDVTAGNNALVKDGVVLRAVGSLTSTIIEV